MPARSVKSLQNVPQAHLAADDTIHTSLGDSNGSGFKLIGDLNCEKNRRVGVLLHRIPGEMDYRQLRELARGKSKLSNLEKEFLLGLHEESGKKLLYITDEQINHHQIMPILLMVNEFRIKYKATNIRFMNEELDTLIRDESIDLTGGSGIRVEKAFLPLVFPKNEVEDHGYAEWRRGYFLDLGNYSRPVFGANTKEPELGHRIVLNGNILEHKPPGCGDYLGKFSSQLAGAEGFIADYPHRHPASGKPIPVPFLDPHNDFTKLDRHDDELDYPRVLKDMVLSYIQPSTPRRIRDTLRQFTYNYRECSPDEKRQYTGQKGYLECTNPIDTDATDFGFDSWTDLIDGHLNGRMPAEIVTTFIPPCDQ